MKKSKSFATFNKQYYNANENYNELDERFKIMANLVDKNQKILDLGCGSGNFIKVLNRKNKSVEGVEISQELVKLGQKNGLKIKIADLHQTFPYRNNIFDTITAGEIIEHIHDTDFFLKEIKRILKPNGFLIISTPNIATLGRRLMLLFGINPMIDTCLENSAGHIRYFTKKSLENILNKHNFEVVNFTSDSINFSNNGRFKSYFLAKIFSTLGARIIIKAKNIK